MKKIALALALLLAIPLAVLAQPNTTTVPRTLMNTSCTANVPLVAAGGTNTVPICWATGALGTMAAQAASAIAVTGGTAAGLTGLAVRDTSAAFDVTIAATSSTTLTAGRTLTVDMVNAARTLKLGANLTLASDPGAVSGVLKSNGTGTFAAAACADLSNGATGCSTTVGTMATQAASAVAITGGTITGTTVSGLTVTTSTGTLTITNAKTLAVSNTLTFTGTDSSSVAFGAGGTVAYNTLAGGGTAAALTASNGGIVYSTASALAILSGTATANQALLSGASTTPAWSTATYPATTTVSQLLYSSSANVIAGLATANGGMLNTSSGGVPSITATPLLGVAGTTAGTLRLSGVTSGVVTMATAAAAGTWTFTVPTSGGTNLQFLQTDGNGTTVWASPSGSGTVNSGTAGQLAYYATSTTAVSTLGSLGTTTTVLHGNAAGAPTFGAVVLTTDVSGVLPAANGGANVAAWTDFSASIGITCGSGSNTGMTKAAFYRTVGKTTEISIIIGQNSATCATSLTLTTAFSGTAARASILPAGIPASGGLGIGFVTSGTASIGVFNAAAAYPLSGTNTIVLNGVIETN